MRQRFTTLSTLSFTFTLFASLLMLPGASLADDGQVQSQSEMYRADFVSQNANPRLLAGQSYQFVLRVKNSGGVSWDRNVVRLGTDRPQDRVPAFLREDIAGGKPSGWVAENRVRLAMDAAGQLIGDTNANGFIDPGETATFEFWYSVPSTFADGTVREYFNLVADNITWFPDLGIFWDVTVDTLPHARWVDQNPNPPTLFAGTSYEFFVRFENTGLIPWKDDGPTLVHLGTDRPQDRIPGFHRHGVPGANSGWLKENRVRMERDATTGKLVGDTNGNTQIDLGEIVRFRFWYTVPATMESGNYQEYFRPVMDNRDNGWMEDYGVFWMAVVSNIAPRPGNVSTAAKVNQLTVSWPGVPEATSYKVRVRPVGGEVFTIFDFPPTMTLATVDVPGGQDVEVGVASVDSEGISPFTASIVHVESPQEAQERVAREVVAVEQVEERERVAEERREEERKRAEEPTPPEPVVTGPPGEPTPTRDWRQFWLTLLIILGAAGLATAGYYGYEWWAEGRRRPRPPRIEPPKKEGPPKPPPTSPPSRTRW